MCQLNIEFTWHEKRNINLQLKTSIKENVDGDPTNFLLHLNQFLTSRETFLESKMRVKEVLRIY